ncbi:MAG: bifunctional proline dehydrogenase/L-glutamate gamma-semialdehyde dehydrogenase PutA [Hoeflea sp.]|uniref:bifunctional proline dehydrogenase/L-glutamate gamma-semialdehyde dehydrogenase PutA n=1 Tax=Hoeflea sp. TaxID=1940281 RepID=UPI001DB042E3|nr:bifunctional proline dehydrogenase/L-glutamate gamma-semialdehyde dehydrogenase PutA [Hoeflea sp.]MBU4527301.1 bifunctional proline dehydrogenase/L-glutamate gamma-semialdehyde dehydrogenase PutA [Alphaproteobacteria bacterium]MBU4546916.1 bifunctional proline dehydrogenase/L-glutamate gamma-semialdehyde dehydrogenase PutA [Alphaproteobacteria bacterium]MBU4551572.1 bifunctional proline dehydrogenase/L-glutamate gamma-semialdehyde dehydrogenase PutA [Alphaproteobacteria bacterium]MBV1725577.
MIATNQPPLTAFHAPHAPDDDRLISAFNEALTFSGAQDRAIDARTTKLIQAIRSDSGQMGGVEDFLREYGLSTREGLALMVLAEALLRVPDALTQDRLIEDKLKEGGWSDHETHGDTWFVSASAWALGMSARVINPGETPEGVMRGLVKRMGMPTVRTATKQAMRFLGHHFVLGETISDALSRAAKNESRGYRHSYDMLGEGARTLSDAKRYFKSYADAIAAIGKAASKTSAGRKLPDRPGISVKLSALHPRYLATHREQVLEELVPDLVRLAQMAKAHDLNFTVDAEEVDRLELSLDVIDRAFADPSLAGWDGFGLAIQAYQKRAPQVIDHIAALCRKHDRKMMVRLVKGAYWDTEIKRAQERGLEGYGVFTRKAATDLSYLACARQMLDLRDVMYPQFATHNALTVSTIIEMAEDPSGFEFQRLHGMGEVVYESLSKSNDRVPCRIYAPVGGYRDLLAYLVRRLLENGANSSFVAVAGDKNVPIASMLERPDAKLGLARGQSARNSQIPLPLAIYPDRPNSHGVEFGDRFQLASLVEGMERSSGTVEAGPIAPGLKGGAAQDVRSPSDPARIVGTVRFTDPKDVDKAVTTAALGFRSWSRTDPGLRAAALDRAADLIEARRDRFMALLSAEAGKTLDDGIAEIREAVDFLRYYAARSRDMFSKMLPMPGPTGEDNRLGWRGRGVFVCISPWNFPLAIFLGQVSAGLAAGNAVIAKPAEQTPLIAHEAIMLLHEAGVPKDVLLCLPGAGDVGAALTSHPKIGGVAFTGSTETARAINRTLAARDGPIVPFIAETGGLNAMIVDATALAEQVADDVVMSAFRSAGQRCSALRLLFVQEDVADQMIEMIEGAARELRLGDPSKPSTDIGPVIDEAQREMLAGHIATISKTQKLVYAGEVPKDGLFFAPHIVELKDASALDREIFGPVLHVVRFKAKKLDTVLDAIDATGFGLTLGVHSRIEATVRKVIDRLDTGNVYINRNMIGAVVGTQPFGGSGLSGTGFKAGGPHYLMRFAVEQAVSVNTAAAGGNAGLIAMGDG